MPTGVCRARLGLRILFLMQFDSTFFFFSQQRCLNLSGGKAVALLTRSRVSSTPCDDALLYHKCRNAILLSLFFFSFSFFSVVCNVLYCVVMYLSMRHTQLSHRVSFLFFFLTYEVIRLTHKKHVVFFFLFSFSSFPSFFFFSYRLPSRNVTLEHTSSSFSRLLLRRHHAASSSYDGGHVRDAAQ